MDVVGQKSEDTEGNSVKRRSNMVSGTIQSSDVDIDWWVQKNALCVFSRPDCITVDNSVLPSSSAHSSSAHAAMRCDSRAVHTYTLLHRAAEVHCFEL